MIAFIISVSGFVGRNLILYLGHSPRALCTLTPFDASICGAARLPRLKSILLPSSETTLLATDVTKEGDLAPGKMTN